MDPLLELIKFADLLLDGGHLCLMENRVELIFALLFRSESPALFATEKYKSNFMQHRMLQKINRPYLNYAANKGCLAMKSETFCAIKKKRYEWENHYN